ncbi:copper amine oxidase N-terminal domain-containing protein [Paenibacillus sp. 481]|uniref:copper amine oxidase N-terminal domain-containing protein n=1 Tax=Paenibacillus sp. 481 TaxID=2835869 RepID=UPI001E31B852|nr:copper amine oxidase N-terminal domain-containing protein [Paenibacillus sp. 481]UHA75115.1 copper amine oxidase N-terminal domain-containing protein [Paenibacillus sp. 481]
MKRKFTVLAAFIMLFSFSNQAQVEAAPTIQINVDGSRVYTDQAPVKVNGRVLVPFAAIFEAMDASVNWNQRTKTVTASKSGKTITLKLGSKTAVVNGRTVKLDVPAQTKRGRTLVPIRFVSESMGARVWMQSNTVYVTTPSDHSSGGSGGNNGGYKPPTDHYDNFTSVTSVNAHVSGNKGDGRDISVNFSRASNESSVSQYRVMVVKSEKASNFFTSTARSVSYSNYTSVYKNGSDHSLSLTSSTRDVDGDLLRANQSYKVFVLTDGTNGRNYGLSNPSQTISLTEGSSVLGVSNIQASDRSDYGDGRDVWVSFSKAQQEDQLSNYRIMLVKSSDAHRFDLSAANAVSSSNYSILNKNGNSTMSTTLSSSARDTSGSYIQGGVTYQVFILSVSNSSSQYSNKLTQGPTFTLSHSIGVPTISKVEDVSNHGDGRDLQVHFSRPSDESKISYYRVFVVRQRDASNFNLSDANNASSSRYYDVSKSGYSDYKVTLSSSTQDTQGHSIRNGENYQVFVMAVSNDRNNNSNTLSTASHSITLSQNNSSTNAPTYVTARDIADYGDGRDLEVSFNRSSDESNIRNYRIMVVKSWRSGNFNLSDANNVSSGNFTEVDRRYSHNNSYYTTTLSASTRDTDGNLIRAGETYQVFVLAMGYNNYSNGLSSASSSIQLSGHSNTGTATNVHVRDIHDYNNASDLEVSFQKAANESNISHYRVMLVKSWNANQFNLTDAERAHSLNYTYVNKTGSDIRVTLRADARDVDGHEIRSGVKYKAFVLSMGDSYSSSRNALSSSSNEVELTGHSTVGAVTNVAAYTVSNYGTARDIEVTFNAAPNESNVAEYRVMVVRSDQPFQLSEANGVYSGNYTSVSRQGNGNSVRYPLSDSTRDVRGNHIVSGVSYRVFVLTVADGRGSQNVLSASSREFTLNGHATQSASNVRAESDRNSSSARVYFEKPSNQNNIAYYTVMVVPSGTNFTLEEANRVSSNGYKVVNTSGDSLTILYTSDNDIYGRAITTGTVYKAYVLSKGYQDGTSVLSASSNEFAL